MKLEFGGMPHSKLGSWLGFAEVGVAGEEIWPTVFNIRTSSRLKPVTNVTAIRVTDQASKHSFFVIFLFFRWD